MARAKLENEENEVKAPDTSTEEQIAEMANEKKGAATVSTAKKTVKIRTVEDVDCLIACKHYSFPKDKEVAVPSDVAAILCYGKKAYRL